MWQKFLIRLLNRVMQDGTLNVTWPDGKSTAHGSGAPDAAITIHDDTAVRALAMKPEVALGECYMKEQITVDDGDLHKVMELIASNAVTSGYGRFNSFVPRMGRALKRFNQNHNFVAARKNVEHHYDLSVELYELFLDDDLQYTCGYFPSDNMDINAAQTAKKAMIARKLMIEPGMRVMDIGCGWGGLSITLAKDYGARVVGVTLSKVQKAHAEKRAKAAGVDHLVEFRLTDYRDVDEEFDRIVVVGMMEHVGQPQYATFFKTMRRNLKPDGIALVHTCGRSSPPNVTAPWIGKYIFPGSYIPAMSEVLTDIEKSDLIVTDIEVWRTHYIKTLQAWRDKFETNKAEIEALYDAEFIRMWRYYLVVSEIGFSHLSNVIFHFQLTRHQTAVPITRDYLLQEA